MCEMSLWDVENFRIELSEFVSTMRESRGDHLDISVSDVLHLDGRFHIHYSWVNY